MILVLVLVCPQLSIGQTIVEQVLWSKNSGEIWKANKTGPDLGTVWRQIGYNASSWEDEAFKFYATHGTVPAGRGYYFRKEFEIVDVEQIQSILAEYYYDDAAALFLNGQEVYRTIRNNLPTDPELSIFYTPPHGGLEDYYVVIPAASNSCQEGCTDTSTEAIPTNLLVEGTNVFGVMVWDRGGSDLGVDLAVTFTRDTDIVVDKDVVINEFMSSNDNGLLDEDGDDSDWIELHNVSASAVNMDGWIIRDLGTEWTFPAVSIDPDEYVVIFASDKNRTDPASELHTSFKLSKEDDELTLVNPEGYIIDQYEAESLLPQFANVSYGRGNDDDNSKGFLSFSTPENTNSANGTNYPPVLRKFSDRIFNLNEPVTIFPSAFDPDGLPVSYELTPLPPGMMINASTGEISGSASSVGVFTSELRVTDDDNLVDTESVDWYVIDTPPGPIKFVLNEYNAVASDRFLDGGEDPAFGAVLGNGGDWFEFVVVEDDLDLRGWAIELWDRDHPDDLMANTTTLVFNQRQELSSIPSGTIITISEEIPDDMGFYPPGDWHLNLQSNDFDAGGFFTAESQENFNSSRSNQVVIIRNASGGLESPAVGETDAWDFINGVSGSEVFSNCAVPSTSTPVDPLVDFDDSSEFSSFGYPNTCRFKNDPVDLNDDEIITQDFGDIRDQDGDGEVDNSDTDTDNDGIPDDSESQTGTDTAIAGVLVASFDAFEAAQTGDWVAVSNAEYQALAAVQGADGFGTSEANAKSGPIGNFAGNALYTFGLSTNPSDANIHMVAFSRGSGIGTSGNNDIVRLSSTGNSNYNPVGNALPSSSPESNRQFFVLKGADATLYSNQQYLGFTTDQNNPIYYNASGTNGRYSSGSTANPRNNDYGWSLSGISLPESNGVENTDEDGDLVDNLFDLDSDNDAIPDVIEAGLTDSNQDFQVDDPAEAASVTNPPDTDSDGIPDFLDLESDNSANDGTDYDIANTGFAALDTNNDGRVDGGDQDGGSDINNNGVDDAIEDLMDNLSNDPPVVEITSPSNLARFDPATPFSVTVQVTDPDVGDSIDSVRVSVGSYHFPTLTTGPPWTFMAELPPGKYDLHAEAWDSRERGGSSSVDPRVTVAIENACALASDIVINEINYNDAAAFQVGDWVELYNPSLGPSDIGGWVLKDADQGSWFIFPEGYVIPGRGFAVVAQDTSAFKLGYPSLSSARIEQIEFGFDNSGDQINLYDTNGCRVDKVQYEDAGLWPAEPDGNGPTLELIDPALDNLNASNWQVSADSPGGSPMAANSGQVPSDGPGLILQLQVYLAGAFTGSEMTTALGDQSLLPLTQPYPYVNSVLVEQSFLNSHPEMVDWIWLELRTGSAASTAVYRAAHPLAKDGQILDPETGQTTTHIKGLAEGDYFIVVGHRNHLSAMTAIAIQLTESSNAVVDLSSNINDAYQVDGAPMQLLSNGKYGLFAGDLNGDGKVIYTGGNNDRVEVLTTAGGPTAFDIAFGYLLQDVNLDGKVAYAGGNNDRVVILGAAGGPSAFDSANSQVPD